MQNLTMPFLSHAHFTKPYLFLKLYFSGNLIYTDAAKRLNWSGLKESYIPKYRHDPSPLSSPLFPVFVLLFAEV